MNTAGHYVRFLAWDCVPIDDAVAAPNKYNSYTTSITIRVLLL